MGIIVEKPISRKRLVKFLQLLLETQSASPELIKRHKPLLDAAIEGLVALSYGEVHEILVPAPKKKRDWYGTKPYTLQKLQMEALGFDDLLVGLFENQNIKKKKTVAIRTVAQAFGLTPNGFRGWRKRLPKSADPLMKSVREMIAHADWDEGEAKERLKKAGAKYKEQNSLAHPT